MLRYVETSALLRALLDGDEMLHPVLSDHGLVASSLTFVEAARAIRRARREQRLTVREAREADRQLAAFERSCDVVALDDEVLRRAREDFPVEPIRSLDAIHLATVVVLDHQIGGLEVVSCDERVRQNAAALGFALLPP
jgi:predicted nucleic acid-binding protein